jgi:hypothetical protein
MRGPAQMLKKTPPARRKKKRRKGTKKKSRQAMAMKGKASSNQRLKLYVLSRHLLTRTEMSFPSLSILNGSQIIQCGEMDYQTALNSLATVPL